MRFYYLFVCFVFNFSLSGQTIINLDEVSSMPLKKELLGVNTGLFYSDVMGERGEGNIMINSYFSPELIKEIDSLNLGHIRFPGGNSANYYHFFGRGGYGTDTFEMICREGYLPPTPSIVTQYGINDGRHAENFAPRVKEMMQGLGGANEKPNFHYIINITTHFFNGDFIKLEEGLNLLLLSRPKLLPFLLFKFKNLAIPQLDEIANELRLITTQNSALFNAAKSNFMKDAAFRKRFDENMAALHYYHNNNVPASHVEYGNEVYAQFMLLDEDLSTIEFDCVLADSTEESFSKLDYLNFQQYSLALLKYYFVTFIYEDSIKKAFPNTKTGLVLAPLRPTMVINENLEIFDVPRGALSLNAYYLWNKFISGFQHGNGIITHLYLQDLATCGVHGQAPDDQIEQVFNLLINHFINTSFFTALEYQHLSLNSSVKKEHWLTEWNMKKNAVSNTYMHSLFVLKFMLNILEWNKMNPTQKIDITSYYNLSTFRNHTYTLLRTGYDSLDVYHIDKQLLYYPIFYLSRAIQNGSKWLSIPDSLWLNENSDSINFYTFYNPAKEQINLLYINHSKFNKNFSNDSLNFILSDKTENFQIESLRLLQSERLMATDYGCPQITPPLGELPLVNSIIQNEVSQSLVLPANSFGEIILKKVDITTPVFSKVKSEFEIYPNPSNGNFYIQTKNINSGNFVVYDLHGKILVSKTNILFPSEINLDLPSGNYILDINNNNQHWQKKLVIVE